MILTGLKDSKGPKGRILELVIIKASVSQSSAVFLSIGVSPVGHSGKAGAHPTYEVIQWHHYLFSSRIDTLYEKQFVVSFKISRNHALGHMHYIHRLITLLRNGITIPVRVILRPLLQ